MMAAKEAGHQRRALRRNDRLYGRAKGPDATYLLAKLKPDVMGVSPVS